MQLTFDPTPFDPVAALAHWLLVVGAAVVLIGMASVLLSLAIGGWAGLWRTVDSVKESFADLFGTSARRCIALARLTFREAYRRKTLAVFGVFLALFLFAGWFLPTGSDNPLHVKAYVSFVLRTISWLVLPVVLLLACWGLPEDIRARSLHTVVTKPVRRHEVILGRIMGFSALGLFLLGVMGAIGYIWIIRQVSEGARDQLVARVPIYGSLTFIDREGRDRDDAGKLRKAGINVGDENPFRSFIDGNTKARAIWDFEKIFPNRLAAPGKLVLESSFQSFRTHKGNMERGLLCQFILVNIEKNKRVPLDAFAVQEFHTNVYDVSERNKTLSDTEGNPVDLEKDLLHDGKLRVEVACLSGGQLVGMARPDLFIRLPDRNFASTYFKTIGSMGMMVFMVVVLGVVAGCFVKGPVATMLTVFVVVVGRTAHTFMHELTSGRMSYDQNLQMYGPGLADALYRIPKQLNPMTELEDSFVTRLISTVDNIELTALSGVQHLFPNFSTFDTTEYAANAFDVPWSEAMLPNLAVMLGYTLPWIVVGYFGLKSRELEAK